MLAAAIVAFVLWLELAVRSAAIAAAALFLPLALAGFAWPATAHWARRLGETLAALVLSKLVIAAVLALAAGLLGSSSGLAGVVEGIALLAVAAFAPFALLKLVPAIEAGAAAHLEGLGRRPVHAARAPRFGHRGVEIAGIEEIGSLAGAAEAVRAVAAAQARRRQLGAAGERRLVRRRRRARPGWWPRWPRAVHRPAGHAGGGSGGICRCPGSGLGRRRQRRRRSRVVRPLGVGARPDGRRQMTEEPPRYQLGPRSRRGLVAGWRGGQLAAVGAGLVTGVLLLRSVGGAVGALLALVVVGATVAFATWPLAGRSAEQWTPVVASHLAHQLSVPRRPRGPLSTLELDEIPISVGGRRIGVVVDKAAGTWTAAVRVGGSGFALGDEADRARRVAAWSGVLAALAREGGALHRLQWVARCLPGGFDDAAAPEAAADRGIAAANYSSLLEHAVPGLWRHEVLVAVCVRASSGPARRRGRETAERMVGELDALERRCVAAGLEVGGALSPEALAAVIRRSTAVAGAPIGVADRWPWPLGVEAGWSSVRTDGTWHAVYWIAEWPRGGVGSGFLLPLLLEGGLRRTIAVTMAPVAPLRAVRRAEHDRTSGAADAELRRRHGFAVTARSRNEHEATTRREAELAQGPRRLPLHRLPRRDG